VSDRTRRLAAVALALGAVAFAALVVSSLGSNAGRGDSIEADGAFLMEMAAGHESAIAMARVALRRAEHPDLERLAARIIRTQDDEIGRMRAAHIRLFNTELSVAAKHGGSPLAAGRSMAPPDLRALRRAKPFDRTFIDMMVAHHEEAVRMARAAIDKGLDEGVRGLAREIVAGQSREIEMMRGWSAAWYGARPSAPDRRADH